MKKYPVLFLLLCLMGCELIVDIDVPFEHEQLTLNSIFNPDSVWTASLSLNRHILDGQPIKRVDNALVIVYQDGAPIDTLLHQSNGNYESRSGKPFIGINYQIRAVAEQYQPVVGRSQIPMPAPIISVEVTKGTKPDGQPDNTVFVRFQDDPAVQNYYEIALEQTGEYIGPPTPVIIPYRQFVRIESDDLGIENVNTNSIESIVFKDIFFNGKEAEVSFKALGSDIKYAGSINVYLRTLSKDDYQYKTTAQLQDDTSGNPFAQPVNVYNNIENGFGIFAGFSQSSFTVSNPRPVISDISPMTGKPGDHIIIAGENLMIPPYGFPTVYFTGVELLEFSQTVRVTETEIEVIVPQNAVTGKIYVRSSDLVATSDGDFEVIN